MNVSYPPTLYSALGAIRRMGTRSTADHRPPPRHFPKRYTFLEQSATARAMRR